MITANKSHILLLSFIGLLASPALYASDNKPQEIKKTNTQLLLEKPCRHGAAIAISSAALYCGIRGLAKKPGIMRTPFSIALICAGLAALYKTEQTTGKSTIQTIVQPLYTARVKPNTKLNTVMDHGYDASIKQLDKAVDFTQQAIAEYVERKY